MPALRHRGAGPVGVPREDGFVPVGLAFFYPHPAFVAPETFAPLGRACCSPPSASPR